MILESEYSHITSHPPWSFPSLHKKLSSTSMNQNSLPPIKLQNSSEQAL